jgi:hypothetical protein
MKNLNAFYYTPEQSSVKYSQNPTGLLDINKLIEGNQKCWISPILPRVAKKKSLVLADWTADSWSPEKIKQVQQSLYDLMREGFSIYLWQDGNVIPMQINQLSLLNRIDIRSSMTLAHNQDIIQASLAQNKLTYTRVSHLAHAD